MPQHSTLSYNQQGENTSRRNLGRNMWGACQSMGTEDEAYTLRVSSLAEVPRIGDTFNNAIVTTVSIKLDSTESLSVSITASVNFNRINEYLGIDQRYRQWAIPAEGVTKELHYSEYCTISNNNSIVNTSNTTQAFRGNFVFGFDTNQQNKKVGMAAIRAYNSPDPIITLPVTGGAFGNSLLFSAHTQDNYSSGKSSVWNNSRVEYIEEPYSLAGEADYYWFWLARNFSQGARTDNLGTGWSLPSMKDGSVMQNTFLTTRIYTYKDPAEQVNFYFQLHVVTDIPALVIGELLTENNPLVKEMPLRTFKLWWLKKKISKFTQLITDEQADAAAEGWQLGISMDDTETYYIFIKANSTGSALPNCAGWAITDNEGRLYIAENDMSMFAGVQRKLYFNFSSTR